MTRSPNPFESPQAVDPPTARENWRPRWREILVGLFVASITMPIAVAILLPTAVTAREFYSRGQFIWTSQLPFRMLLVIWAVAGSIAIVVGLPLCMVTLKWGRLHASSVLVFGLLTASIIVGYHTVPYVKGSGESWFSAFIISEIVWSALAIFAPFAVFALYLAYLRSRDLRRTASPSQ